jgi:hypothetical protein
MTRFKFSGSLSIILLPILIIVGLVACGGGGGGGGGGSTVASSLDEVIGLWVGECKDNTMTLSFKDTNDLYVIDFEGGNSFGTFTYNNNRLCMNITTTNGEGCSPPAVGEYCTEITINADDMMTFIDFTPGDLGEPFHKVITSGPYVWSDYVGYWSGTGTNLDGIPMTVEVSIWTDGTVDYYLNSSGCYGGVSDEMGKWGREAYDHTYPGTTQTIQLTFDSNDFANCIISHDSDCLTITTDITKQSSTPTILY